MSNHLTIRSADEGEMLAVVSDLYTVKASGEETGGAYVLFGAVVPPGGGTPPHIHEREDEAFYVLEGEMTFYTEGREVVLGPGGFIHLPRKAQHNFRNNGNKIVRALIQAFPAGLENYFREAGIVVQDPANPPAVDIPKAVEQLVALAPNYGITILLP